MIYVPKTKAKHVPKEDFSHFIDSLKNVIYNLDSLNQVQLAVSKIKDSIINQVNQKIQKLIPATNDLQLKISKYEELNRQTEKYNFNLIAFNSAVSVLLLIMFIRYVRKLRKERQNIPAKQNVPALDENTQANVELVQGNIETNLNRLEKLGRLKNSGILSEEEFSFQKQQILGLPGN
jgi:hypothetical protein